MRTLVALVILMVAASASGQAEEDSNNFCGSSEPSAQWHRSLGEFDYEPRKISTTVYNARTLKLQFRDDVDSSSVEVHVYSSSGPTSEQIVDFSPRSLNVSLNSLGPVTVELHSVAELEIEVSCYQKMSEYDVLRIELMGYVQREMDSLREQSGQNSTEIKERYAERFVQDLAGLVDLHYNVQSVEHRTLSEALVADFLLSSSPLDVEALAEVMTSLRSMLKKRGLEAINRAAASFSAAWDVARSAFRLADAVDRFVSVVRNSSVQQRQRGVDKDELARVLDQLDTRISEIAEWQSESLNFVRDLKEVSDQASGLRKRISADLDAAHSRLVQSELIDLAAVESHSSEFPRRVSEIPADVLYEALENGEAYTPVGAGAISTYLYEEERLVSSVLRAYEGLRRSALGLSFANDALVQEQAARIDCLKQSLMVQTRRIDTKDESFGCDGIGEKGNAG